MLSMDNNAQTAPLWVLVFVCFISFVNSFDRSIIPSAPAQFQYFIQTTTNTTDEGALLGLLSSAFVTTFAISMPIFGYQTKYVKPFNLIAIGMAVWCFAAFLCALSKPLGSFELLFVGQLLSGIGEASFSCIGGPLIHDHAPISMQTMWLSFFTLATVVGGTAGGIVASSMASTAWGWESVFAVESAVILLMALVCAFCIPEEVNQIAKDDNTNETTSLLSTEVPQENKKLVEEIWCLLGNKIFLWISLGTAAITFYMSSVGTLSMLLLLSQGTFSSEADANVQLGLQGVITTVVGMLVGSLVLDLTNRGDSSRRVYNALRQTVIGLPCCILSFILAIYSLPNKTLYFVWSSLTTLISAPLNPIMMTALYGSVDPSKRALATGVRSLITHALGDVPAPLVLGSIRDAWAPHCNSIQQNGVVILNPECKQDKDSLINAVFFSTSWIVWSVMCFGYAMYVASKATKPTSKAQIQV